MPSPIAALTCLLATLSAAGAAPEPAYRGRVDAGGSPLAGAEVVLLPAPGAVEVALALVAGEEPEPLARARTGADGRFVLVPPDARPARIRVRAPGWAEAEIAAPPPLADVELLPLVLPPEREIRIDVVDSRGQPVAGRVVLVSRGLVDLGVCIDGLLDAPRCGWSSPPAAAILDEAGSARLPAPASPRDRLLIDAPGHPRGVEFEALDRPSRRVVLASGEERRLRAVDASGRPIAGASVLAGLPLPLAVTGADGRAIVWAEPGTTLDVHLRTPDAASADARLPPKPASAAAPEVAPEVEVVLQPARRLMGRALDRATGAPLAGVVVAALTAARSAVSAADGSWELRVTAGAAVDHVAARARGYVPVVSPVSAEETTVSLTRSVALEGRLVDREGTAVAGARVVAFPTLGRPSLTALDRPADPLLGSSRADGGFRLDGAAPGLTYQLEAEAAGFRPVRTTVTAGASPLELILEPGIAVRGRVVDLEEVPIAGASIALRDPALGWGSGDRPTFAPAEASATTDAEGRFLVPDQAPGLWDLDVAAAGFARTRIRGVEVPETVEHDVGTVALGRAATLAGTVVDAVGRAIAGATVELGRSLAIPGGGRGRRTASSTTTADDGTFRFDELVPGEAVDLTVSAAAHASRQLDGLTPPLATPLAIELTASARLAGRVVDEEAEPVAAAWVAAYRPEPAGRIEGVETGADGDFELEVDPGVLQVRAQVRDAAPAALDLELAAGEDRRDLVLTVRRARATVVGYVRRADGSGVAGAQVSVKQDGYSPGGLSGGDGAFRLSAAPGPAKVFAAAHGPRPGGAQLEVVLVAGENRVDLVLPADAEGVTVRGHVLAPDGAPVPGAAVAMAGVAGETDGAGAFELRGVPPGTRSTRVTAAGFPSLSLEDLEVPAAGLDDLVLTLEPGAVVRGRLLGLGVDELACATVTLRDDSGGYHPAVLRPDGSFRIEGAASGPATLAVSFGSGRRTASERIEVPPPGGELEVELDLAAGYALDGVVTIDGRPVQGARVTAVPPDGRRQETTTDWQGGFQLVGLDRGPHHLTVEGGSEHRGVHLERTVDPADEPRLVLDLPWTTVEGRVLGPDGAPLEGAQVFARLELPRGGPFAVARTDATGTFRLGPLGPGRWQLQVVGTDLPGGGVTVDLVEGVPVRDLDLVVATGSGG